MAADALLAGSVIADASVTDATTDLILPQSTNDITEAILEEEHTVIDEPPSDSITEQQAGVTGTEGLPPTPVENASNTPAEPLIRVLRRPILSREGSVPSRIPPPSAPPPAPPSNAQPLQSYTAAQDYTTAYSLSQASQQPLDAATLEQIQATAPTIPPLEPNPYAFVYSDAASLPEEIEEWFSYNVDERARILRAQSSFAQEWASANGWIFLELDSSDATWSPDWTQVKEEERQRFMQRLIGIVSAEKGLDKRLRALEALTYLSLGAWKETAGLSGQGRVVPQILVKDSKDEPLAKARSAFLEEAFGDSGRQIEWIQTNTRMMFECDGLQAIYDLCRQACLRDCENASMMSDKTTQHKEAESRETWCALTVLYICLEVARSEMSPDRVANMRSSILQLSPAPAIFLCDVIGKLRWEDSVKLPLVKILLLLWKTTLVSLGSLDEIDKAKASFQNDIHSKETSGPLITASPLDYHTFRQEISSKYPAYVPPLPIFPIEPEARSMLPPLRFPADRRPSEASNTQNGFHGTSILNQPVHIATPAPSPPPSPAVGKGGKKQNYQTNQLFPFMYPPLDATSNRLGGKGSTDLQDALVGRKWTGSDIPASILEAADLFSKRMRATRAMKQLWEERVRFMKFERGWAPEQEQELPESDSDDDVEDFDLKAKLEELGLEDDEEEIEDSEVKEDDIYGGPSLRLPQIQGSVEDRLQQVERFYRDGLPHLQSLVMVLLKSILANVTSLITQSTAQNGGANSYHLPDGPNTTSKDEMLLNGWDLDASRFSEDDLDTMRVQEITAKAASGVLILLLKWFKVSHILKFEYLTQLLVDANYIPMILKLFQTQEIDRLVNYRPERDEYNFFTYCRTHSNHAALLKSQQQQQQQHSTADADQPCNGHSTGPPSVVSSKDLSEDGEEGDSSPDESLPPPIKRHRSPPLPPSSSAESTFDGAINTQATPESLAAASAASAFSAQSNAHPEVDELGLPLTAIPSTPITNFSPRTLLSTTNHLRVLQKICKHKPHRNLMLVTYKSATFLKKLLKIPQPLLRLYALKIFKNQVPYCGRKWRQANMRVITGVYLRLRPGLRDEWLCHGDVDAEVEGAVPGEQALRSLTHYFNLERYAGSMGAEKGMLREERDVFVRELERLDWGEDLVRRGSEEMGGGEEMWEGGEGGFPGQEGRW